MTNLSAEKGKFKFRHIGVIFSLLHNVFILKRSSGLTIFKYQIKPFETDSSLIGGLLTAVQMFCREIHIGELTTFRTTHFQIIISVRNHVIVALFLDKTDNEEFWQFRAFEIGHRFENEYLKNLEKFQGEISIFKDFRSIIQDIIKEEEESGLFQILKWLRRSYNGDLHICSSDPIDIAIDLGPKQHFHSFNHLFYVKLYNRSVKKKDLLELLNFCRKLGFKQLGYKIDTIFPTKLIVFGQEYEKELVTYLKDKLSLYENKHFFVSNELDLNIRSNPELSNIFYCYLELWLWNPVTPKLIFS